jgi:hypothetical protein
LKREHGLAFHELDWGEKNRSAGRMFLEHALLVSDVMVEVECACRGQPGVRLLTGKSIPLPESLRANPQPFKWNAGVKDNYNLSVIPDGVFVLEFPAQPADRRHILYMLEADTGTMPVIRATLAQSSFQRKLLAYEATWTQNIHRSRLGFSRFRVLTVTTSANRVKSLVKACAELKRGQGLFLFTEVRSLLAHPQPFLLDWQSGRNGTTGRILED